MSEIELIKKYLDNRCSPEERQRANELISNNKGNKIINQLIDNIWEDNHKEKLKEKASESIYRDLEAILDAEANYVQKPNVNKRYFLNTFKYAASVAIISMVGYLGFQYQHLFLVQNEQKAVAVKYITKSTTNGQKSTIILGDGTKVVLNSASAINYPLYFTDSNRVVVLAGEAFFEVTEDKKRPFSVITGSTTTVALGTSFNINTKSPEFTKVSLATGKVMVSHHANKAKLKGDNLYFLQPGEALKVNKLDSSAQKSKFDVEEDLLWKDGVLYFKDCTFQQIVDKLEPWYDIKFNISNGHLTKKTYTGKFDNASLERLLKNVGFTLGFDYFINKKNVTIIFNDK